MPNTSEGSKIVQNFEKASFPDKPSESVLPIKSELYFDNERPAALNVEGKIYRVDSRERSVPAKKFFENTVRRKEDGTIESITFYDPAARRYVADLMRFYVDDTLADISKNLDTELQLEGSLPPGKYKGSLQEKVDKQYKKEMLKAIRSGFPYRDEGKIQTLARGVFEPETDELTTVGSIPMFGENWFSDKQEDILGWINQLIQEDVPIKQTSLIVQTGEGKTRIRRTVIGAIEGSSPQEYAVEKDVLKTMFFLKENLGFPLRKDIEIFDTSVFEETDSSLLHNHAIDFMTATGMSYRSRLFINSRAVHRITGLSDSPEGETIISGSTELHRRSQSRTTVHETTHYMDDTPATRPQREGLATAVEMGFDFNRSLDRLTDYSNEVSPARLKLIFSKEPPKYLTSDEVYYLSASFYCWLYKEIGSENFATFYTRLSGKAENQYKTKSVKRQFLGPFDDDPALHWKGDLSKSLDSLPHDYHWTWKTSEDLLNNFVADFEGFRKR